jgi:hypothetical protein
VSESRSCAQTDDLIQEEKEVNVCVAEICAPKFFALIGLISEK